MPTPSEYVSPTRRMAGARAGTILPACSVSSLLRSRGRAAVGQAA